MATPKTPDSLVLQVQPGATLPERVAEQLRSMILQGTLQPGARLPTEPELSRLLNVSRSTLRSALDRLEREGFVARRRGVGTFVADEPLVVNNLNLNWGVTQVIRSIGAQPGTVELSVRSEPASHRTARHLGLQAGDPIVLIERVRTADGRRVVLSWDMFPEKFMHEGARLIPPEELQEFLQASQSMYAFMREHLSLETHHAIAWLRPVTAERLVAEKLHVPIDSGLLYLEQVDYDADGNPLILADEYHVAGAFTFTVYRTGQSGQ